MTVGDFAQHRRQWIKFTFPGGYGGYAPKTRALIDATYIVGLRKAGMPEE